MNHIGLFVHNCLNGALSVVSSFPIPIICLTSALRSAEKLKVRKFKISLTRTTRNSLNPQLIRKER